MEFNAVDLAALFPSFIIIFIITYIGDDFFWLQVLYQMVKMGVSQYTNNKANCALG
jgi:hypothetical protein